MRGEYSNAESKGTTSAELPPRARRILGRTESKIRLIGTTSACAENTQSQLPLRPSPGNYLRVRGEYGFDAVVDVGKAELPPRARRIPWGFSPTSASKGTTSACAENTNRLPAGLPAGRNYLRVRGEYPRPGAGRFFYPELPPRARRIRLASIPPRCGGGTTSACAENTVRKNTCD